MGEVRFTGHKTVRFFFFFLACVPARALRRHILMSLLLKVITREAEKRYHPSDLPCVWGDIRIHLGYGF